MSYTPSFVHTAPTYMAPAIAQEAKASFTFTNKAEIRIKIMMFAAMLTCFIVAVNI